jgi:hypothetical protein
MLTRLINGDLLLHFTPSQQSNNIHYKPQLDPLATALESISERADRAISTGPTTTERRSSGQPHRPKSSSQTPLSPPQASQRGLVLAKKKKMVVSAHADAQSSKSKLVVEGIDARRMQAQFTRFQMAIGLRKSLTGKGKL